jgi:serine/threonine protein kinase
MMAALSPRGDTFVGLLGSQPVIIKKTNGEIKGEEMKRQKRILQKFRNSPRINRMIDAFMEGDGGDMRETVAYELINGYDLLCFSGAENFTGPNEANFWKVAEQIAEGLSILHACNIFHKDLKPLNVMVRYPVKHPEIPWKEVVSQDFEKVEQDIRPFEIYKRKDPDPFYVQIENEHDWDIVLIDFDFVCESGVDCFESDTGTTGYIRSGMDPVNPVVEDDMFAYGRTLVNMVGGTEALSALNQDQLQFINAYIGDYQEKEKGKNISAAHAMKTARHHLQNVPNAATGLQYQYNK